jgi:DNA polymerase-3 subunit beta
MTPLPAATADHSRYVQRIRRRYTGHMACLSAGAPDRPVMEAAYAHLRAQGLEVGAALRIVRQLVMERIIVLDCEQQAPLAVVTKAVTELQRLLGDDGEVVISSSKNLVSFTLNGSQLVSKLVEGNYPNYRQVIPGEAKERIAIEREALLNCVRRVALLSSDKTSSLRLSFTKNNLDITATTPEVGEAMESMSVNYRGRDIAIAFNPEFLMDPLRNLPNDEVYLELIDEMSPGVIKIQTPFLYVIMPMRVSS